MAAKSHTINALNRHTLVQIHYTRVWNPFRAVIFNGGEIGPAGPFHALWGRFCDLSDLGGDFSFPEGDFFRLKYYKILN